MGTLATTALVGIGLNALFGLAGEVSLGQGGFLALGAYGVGILTTKAGFGFWEALPLAVLLVAAISAGFFPFPRFRAGAFISSRPLPLSLSLLVVPVCRVSVPPGPRKANS